jgi:GntR family transcriptional regulator, transcriptional repressor for pyruvate dehydrogenase complex
MRILATVEIVVAHLVSSRRGNGQAHRASPKADAARTPLPRLPGLVADALRQQILHGELPEGARLPKEEVLRERFGVGRPVMREAMRILEAEGLVTVLRGNQGGALVRKPRPQHTTYALSLLLSSRGVRTRDVGKALKELEPICASLCAQRSDRHAAVVPALRKIHDASREVLGDPEAASMLFRSFHESIVAQCGNQTLMVLVGALEAIWSENVRLATARSGRKRTSEELERSFRDHQVILHRIEQGDGRGVTRAVIDHISRVQAAATRANADNRIVLPIVRKNVIAMRPPTTTARNTDHRAPAWRA